MPRVNGDVAGDATAGDAVPVSDGHPGAAGVVEPQATLCAATSLTKLWVELESRRAVSTWGPMATRICMVSAEQMLVIACSEISGGGSSWCAATSGNRQVGAVGVRDLEVEESLALVAAHVLLVAVEAQTLAAAFGHLRR